MSSKLLKSELLARVINRLSDPRRWVKAASARDVQGLRVDAKSKNAVSWCITGVIRRELAESGFLWDATTTGFLRDDLTRVFRQQFPEFFSHGFQQIEAFNDHKRMTHPDLMAALEKAHVNLLEKGE